MSQLFSKDAVGRTGSGILAQVTATTLALGNALVPPYGNCKMVILGIADLQPEASCTAVTLAIIRNPAGENTTVATKDFDVTGGKKISIPFGAIDAIPDGRPCNYSLVCTQTGAAGTGSYNNPTLLDVTCISG
jgi:hypothetical protein